MKFNVILKKLRNEYNITQEELSSKLGYSRATISAWEIGRNEPAYDDLIKISNFFNVTVDYLLGKEDIDLDDVSFAFSSELEGLSEEQISIVRSFVKTLNEENKKKK